MSKFMKKTQESLLAGKRRADAEIANLPITAASAVVSSLAGDKRGTRGIQPGVISQADVCRYSKAKYPDQKCPGPGAGYKDAFQALAHEFTDPTSDLAKFFGVKQPEPQKAQQVAQEIPQELLMRMMADYELARNPYALVLQAWVDGEFDDFPPYDPNNNSHMSGTNKKLIERLFTEAGLELPNAQANLAMKLHFNQNFFQKADHEWLEGMGKGVMEARNSQGWQGVYDYSREGNGGRKPSAYAQFVKQYAAKHPGPDLMKRAAAAWKSQK